MKKQGYREKEVTFSIVAGGRASIIVTLQPIITVGSVSFSSEPIGAQIWVDETNTGKTTTATVENLKEGNHSYGLRKEGYVEVKGTFYVKAEETVSVPISVMVKVPVSPSATPVPETERKKPKLVDFLPRSGETIEGFKIGGETITSGTLEQAGVSYYPEDVTIWSDYSLIAGGKRFASIDDLEKAMAYKNPKSSWGILSEEGVVDLSGWKTKKSTQQWIPDGSCKGTYKSIIATYDVYRIAVSVKVEAVSYAEEKAENIMKVLILRYKQAL